MLTVVAFVALCVAALFADWVSADLGAEPNRPHWKRG